LIGGKIKIKNNIKILDCTFRDGGYYNNWDFDAELVDKYLKAISKTPINAIEIGFRMLPKQYFLGPFAYSGDDFISSLSLPDDKKIAVMINAKEFISHQNNEVKLIQSLFAPCSESPIDIIRAAINFLDARKVKKLVDCFKDLGYEVALNLMQSSGYPPDDYISLLEELRSWDNIDILYFADSLGNMDSTEVTRICNLFQKHWEGDFGFHAHNNRGFALSNSLVAIENGASWCDGTILGMGRGAGNTPMENLLLSLQDSGLLDFDPGSLYELIEGHFLLLQKKYNWGPNFSYHYAALSKIHPTFVQRLLSEKRYDSEQVLSALKYLSGIDARSYNQDLLRTAVFPLDEDQKKGTWDATGWLEGREALIIGAGPSVKKHLKGIINYIKNNQPAVLVLNMKKEIPVDLVTAYIACHPSRIMIEVGSYKNLEAPLILPLTQFSKFLGEALTEVEILDYGLGLVKNGIQIGAKGCGVEQPLAIGYALAVATQAGVKGINLVGFDGYSADDPRQEEMNDLIHAYSSDPNAIQLLSLTPTSYDISQGSIYASKSFIENNY